MLWPQLQQPAAQRVEASERTAMNERTGTKPNFCALFLAAALTLRFGQTQAGAGNVNNVCCARFAQLAKLFNLNTVMSTMLAGESSDRSVTGSLSRKNAYVF